MMLEDKHRAPHPIVDRYAGLGDKLASLGFQCLDQVWRGRSANYRFQCQQRHAFTRNLQGVLVTRHPKCPECVGLDHTARLHALAGDAAAVCLEAAWLGYDAMHRFRCVKGHAWTRKGCVIHAKTLRCPACSAQATRRRQWLADGLQRLKRAAAARGGQCLATDYQGARNRYRFRCDQGHEWESKGTTILHQEAWCPWCFYARTTQSKLLSDGLPRIHAAARDRGGECLDATYAGTNATYRFRCASGHEWSAKGASILVGGWCRACFDSRRRLGMEVAHKMAADRGGRCLSTEYVTALSKLHWLCHRGHAWYAPISSIRRGCWCAECAHMNKLSSRTSKARLRYRAGGDKGERGV